MNKLQKALKVVNDLKTLTFTINDHSGGGKVFTITHPKNNYSIWTGNGFWFIALYEVGGQYVDDNHAVSKFGALGKLLVWREVRKILRAFKKYKVQETLAKI